MKERVKLKFRRYLSSDEFLSQLYRGIHHGDSLLDWFEESGLVRPIIRLVWPEAIARRWWRETRDWAGVMVDEMEPDGLRLNAAVELANALFKLRGAHNDLPHPLDDPDPTWEPFLQRDAAQTFVRRAERRYSIGNALHAVAHDRGHLRDFYSAWQVLAAAEIAEMGIFFRLDMTNDAVAEAARIALRERRAPDGPAHEVFAPNRALRGLREHRAALDAAVWASEEGEMALLRAARSHGGRRFQLTETEDASYRADRETAARVAMARHTVDAKAVLALCRFLAEQWIHWDDQGRPLIAEAYRIHLAAAVRMLQVAEGLSFEQVVQQADAETTGTGSLLRRVWPDWSAEQQERLTRTLRSALPVEGPGAVSNEELEEFATFLDQERQDAIFLRLGSFERHAFDTDDPAAMGGRASDLQGVAVAVEHVVRAMGGQGDQLYDMFKRSWHGTPVDRLLRANEQLARNGDRMKDWPALKAEIAALAATGAAGTVAANLIMAHRMRGAVHNPMAEDDQFELERILVQVLAAAAMTHAHVSRQALRAAASLPEG
ncbi:hypothetical protein [Devosia sp.]|uniref:hypothetical protein n=1 Tax=Devosia sp. TaxID=1871048 RepID=UPI0019EC9F6A|nr:hypothetical protein [Devosia sp.]MBE0581262.1 hypothetical protein [Devosia sp.]